MRAGSGAVLALAGRIDNDIGCLFVPYSEAHPVDEWKLYTDICYEQPKTLADRMDKARLYLDVSKTQVPMSVDTLDNHAETAFSARSAHACTAVWIVPAV